MVTGAAGRCTQALWGLHEGFSHPPPGQPPLCTPSVRGRVSPLAMAIFIYFWADIRIVFIMPYVKLTFFRSVHYLERISGEPPLGRISLGPTWVPDVFLSSFLMVSSLSGF